MKIHWSSWAAVIVCVCCGMTMFHLLATHQSLYDEFGLSVAKLPRLTQFFWAARPVAWLALFTAFGIIAVVKDFFVEQKKWILSLLILALISLIYVFFIVAIILPMHQPLRQTT